VPPLDGRVALVTGAGSAIGRATALRLATEPGAIGILSLSPNAGTVLSG
jgi:NAD(P)-dependent dehydrogenase (short-subunit alcohol dehydrogenase family)